MDSRRSSTSHKHWKLNWWDLWPLVEGERRPLQWTNESLILSPHPSTAAVTGRIFPSTSSFILPPPNQILNAPASYCPPSVIEASPETDYVFAFFQGIDCDSLACIWKRENALDSWKLETHWTLGPGQGIVFAKWLDPQRHWYSANPPARSPPLGPAQAFIRPGLVLVCQNHMVQFVHRLSLSSTFQMVWASLRQATRGTLNERVPAREMVNGPGGVSVCVKAALGCTYNESSLIIATHSTLMPPLSTDSPEYAADFVNLPAPSTSPVPLTWETFGPETSIQLCEVRITSNNCHIGVVTNPLPSINPQVTSSARLIDMLILPHLHLGPQNGQGSGGSPDEKDQKEMMVVLSYLDTEDFSTPKSELLCYEIMRNINPSPDNTKKVDWIHRHIYTRPIIDSAISFIIPSRRPGSATIFLGLLDLEGFTPRHVESEKQVKEVRIGKVVRKILPDFRDDDGWDPSALMVDIDDVESHPPLSAALSPNEVFLCSSSSAWDSASRLGIHTLPRLRGPTDIFPVELTSELLHAAILSRRTLSDITHTLSNPGLSLNTVMDVLETLSNSLTQYGLVAREWSIPLARLSIEIYLARLHRWSKENTVNLREKEVLDERARVAIEVISMHVFRTAFDACKEEEGYDLDHIWPLISLSTWLVDFCEKLLRICVLWESKQSSESKAPAVASDPKVKPEIVEMDDPNLLNSKPDVSSENSSLIHLVHPFALANLIGALAHINAFRTFLGSLSASQLRSEIAKEVLLDAVDNSGIKFSELEAQLRQVQQLNELRSLDEGLLRRCLISMAPLFATHESLSKACKLAISSSCVSKPQLFIKPGDLVDGISRLSVSAKSKERDVISKAVLGLPEGTRTCLRCHGKTDLGHSKLPTTSKELKDFSNWIMWEHQWARCICGGAWVKNIGVQ
ncbi:hypothetical protein M422DRAFT_30219 [Sphaerobolus stellatus SS14]|uniref:Mediator complex subunit 16 C-terminal domain-containing protein n=1 Tax=Sphaerobolus stellatus (strain SS14) TaxID=990650 RepID=A0A0C9VQW7_SPHS4|nr:hypothetical protein M422DRAFT_30219 [Sphaerobolus stellatus SS14]